ncbi:MAG: elongation factor P [Arsenophonus sp. ET-DL9-MAG3]
MATYNTNEFYSGLKIILDNEPCIILESEFVKPGKGQAFARVRIRKLLSNKLIEKTFKSTDSVKSANVIDMNLSYLYNDGKFWYFINNKTFEQLAVNEKTIGNNKKWLINQINCIVTLWNGQAITITLPTFIELIVTDTNPSIKGDLTGTNKKIAILNTGAMIKVPLFIQIGEVIKVDTRSAEYVSRIK